MNFLTRMMKRPANYGMLKIEPLSRKFGFDRGTPIDRYYIEKFLKENSEDIHGVVLEIAESTYSRQFEGAKIEKFEVLHAVAGNPNATIIGDLANPITLPENRIDCFICTQTLNCIYDFKTAVAGAHRLLKPGGVVLATVPGISQISRYDMERWGDYWRFTSLSARKIFEESFPGSVTINIYGNLMSAKAFLDGFAVEDLLDRRLLDVSDPDYELIIGVVARKES